jgi:HEAT repeat protein
MMIAIEDQEKKERKAQGIQDALSQIDSLIKDLHNEDGIVRQEARQTLEFIGRPAVDFLNPLLKEPNDDVRWEAAKALTEIADPRAASPLADILMDHNFGVRWLGAEGLIAIGRTALGPVLEQLVHHPDSAWLRERAHHVLHDLSQKDPEVKALVAPVLAALEGVEPEIGVLEPAYAVLDKLRSSAKRADES